MRALAFIVTVLALVPVILYRPWVGVIAWDFTGLINPQGFMWGWAADFPYAILIGGSTLLGMFRDKSRQPIPLTTQTVMLGLLTVWFCITTPLAWNPDGAWYQLIKVGKILLMTFVTMMLIHGELRLRVLLLAITVAVGLLGIKGGLFTLVTGGKYMVQGPGGFLGGNTELGLALTMVIPLMIAFAAEATKRWQKIGFWGAFWLCVLATGFTYSRGALLGLGAVLLAMFWGLKRKMLVVAVVVPALIASLAFVPEQLINRASTIERYQEDESAMGRIQAWGVAINVAMKHPTGGGFNLHDNDLHRWLSYAYPSHVTGREYMTRAAHSIYFQVLGDHGFLALGLFLVLLYATWRSFGRCMKAAKKRPDIAWMGRYAWALRLGLVGYMVSGAFLSLAYFDLFYTFVALSVVMQRELSKEPSRPPMASTAATLPAPALAGWTGLGTPVPSTAAGMKDARGGLR